MRFEGLNESIHQLLAMLGRALAFQAKWGFRFGIQTLPPNRLLATPAVTVLFAQRGLKSGVALRQWAFHSLSRCLGHRLTLHRVHSGYATHRALIERYRLLSLRALGQLGYEIIL